MKLGSSWRARPRSRLPPVTFQADRGARDAAGLSGGGRRRNSDKRGGDQASALITFDEALAPLDCRRELLLLDTALTDLARIEPRQAMLVESRFFGGLEIDEIAELLDVSRATIIRDWRAAKAWLAHELGANHYG